MNLDLSLYHLAEGSDLLELFEMRAEAERACSEPGIQSPELDDMMHDLAVLDEQISAYMAALPAKVDGVRAVWKRIETLIAESAAEVKLQSKRGQHLKADLERLKDYCQRCMELIEWKPNKPRKLEGRSGYLLLKANGGRPAVEVYDEALIPAHLSVAEGRVPLWIWQSVLRYLHLAGERGDATAKELARDMDGCSAMKAVPSLSLIAEQLAKPCPAGCVNGIAVDNGIAPDEPCPECGGSGHASVPGARLKPQGQHVEVK